MIYNLLRALSLFIVCCQGTFVSAQRAAIDLPDPALAARPRLILLSGVGAEGSTDAFQTFFLSAERAVSAYQHLGVQYTSYLSAANDLYSYTTLRKGSYEIGLISKFFLHGRLSGRRSHLYYGPQLRFSSRKMLFKNSYINNNVPYNYQVNATKVMFCLGGQYNFGPAVFEWSLPLGVEYSRSNLPTSIDPYNYYSSDNSRNFTAIPSLSLGFRL